MNWQTTNCTTHPHTFFSLARTMNTRNIFTRKGNFHLKIIRQYFFLILSPSQITITLIIIYYRFRFIEKVQYFCCGLEPSEIWLYAVHHFPFLHRLWTIHRSISIHSWLILHSPHKPILAEESPKDLCYSNAARVVS